MHAHEDFYNELLLPDIKENPARLEHMITYITEDCYKITVDSVQMKKVKTKTELAAASSFEIEELTKLILQNVELFKPFVHTYQIWLTLAIKMVISDLPYECFCAVSEQDSKFDESAYLEK